MKRVLILTFVMALLVAACGDDDTGTTTPPPSSSTSSSSTTSSTSTTSTSTSTTSTSTTSTTTTSTTLPPFTSIPIDLELTAESTDPLETIEALGGVAVTVTRDGEIGFTFDSLEHGDPLIQLTGAPPNVFVVCSTFDADGVRMTQCFAQTPDGFPVVDSETPEDFPPMTVWVPNITVTPDSISIEIDGTTYVGTGIIVEDGPVMVAINPDGSLQNEVVRRSGEIDAADLAAAVG